MFLDVCFPWLVRRRRGARDQLAAVGVHTVNWQVFFRSCIVAGSHMNTPEG